MNGKRILSATLGVAVTLLCAASSIGAKEITLRLYNPAGLSTPAYPFTVGVPFARDEMKVGVPITLVDESGHSIPVQQLVTATWDKEGRATRWLLLDFVTALKPDGATLTLRPGTSSPAPIVAGKLVSETADAILLDTGRVKILISKKRFNLFEQVWAHLNNNDSYESSEAMCTSRLRIEHQKRDHVVGPTVHVPREQSGRRGLVRKARDVAELVDRPEDGLHDRSSLCGFVRRSPPANAHAAFLPAAGRSARSPDGSAQVPAGQPRRPR